MTLHGYRLVIIGDYRQLIQCFVIFNASTYRRCRKK